MPVEPPATHVLRKTIPFLLKTKIPQQYIIVPLYAHLWLSAHCKKCKFLFTHSWVVLSRSYCTMFQTENEFYGLDTYMINKDNEESFYLYNEN